MPGGPPPRLRYIATSANGQPALGTYGLHASGAYLPIALDVLTVGEDGITRVIAFRDAAVFARFGMPERIESASDCD